MAADTGGTDLMQRNKILKNSVVVIVLIIIGKVFGIIRDMLLSGRFGVGKEYDIYSFSLKVIFLLTALSYGITTTLIPVQTEHISAKTKEDNNNFVNNILNITILCTIIFTILSIALAKYIIILFAHGYTTDSGMYRSSVTMLRVMLVSLIFISAQSVLTGVVQAHNKFYIPAAMAIFSNLVYIVYLILFANKFGIMGFAVATVIGFFLQMAVNIPQYLRLGYKYKFYIDFHNKELQAMFIIMLPVIISSSYSQLNLFVSSSVATNLFRGAPSVIDYSNKLNTLVDEVFATAVTMVVYPTLAACAVKESKEEYKNVLIKSINVILLVMVPAAIGMAVLRQPLLTVLFKRGKFDNRALAMTSFAVLFYCPSMIANGARGMLNKAFYSIKDTKTPMINSLIGVLFNIVLCLIFIKFLSVAGITLAASVSAILTTILMLFSLNNKLKNIEINKIFSAFLKIFIASSIMGIILFFMNKGLSLKFGDALKGSLISLVICFISGVVVYFASIHTLKLEEYVYMVDLVKEKLKK